MTAIVKWCATNDAAGPVHAPELANQRRFIHARIS